MVDELPIHWGFTMSTESSSTWIWTSEPVSKSTLPIHDAMPLDPKEL